MLHGKGAVLLSASIFLACALFAADAGSQEFPDTICEVAVHEESVELQDYRNTVDLAVSSYEAYLKIFKMIEGLHEGNTIPRMDYVEAKYNRDAAKLELERADLVLQRQAALVEQYRLACGMSETDGNETDTALRSEYIKYRRADCESLEKGVEVAATNLEFYREYLKNILDLRKENHATRTQVILAELDVELEEKNFSDTRRRSDACRAELEDLEDGIR